MKIWLAFAAFVLLLVFILCARILKKGFTPLSSNQAMWRAKFKQEEARLAKEQMEITPSEQVAFLGAAVRDVLNLDNLTNLTCTRQKNGLKVEDGEKAWLLTYKPVQQTNLPGSKKRGKAHWILTVDETDYDFDSIDQLIQAFRRSVKNEPINDLDSYEPFTRPKNTFR